VTPGPTPCHDITVYPAIGLAAGACGGYGLLLDIRDVAHPTRRDAVADSNFSYWHSATFNNNGTKLLFSDEWGGGGQPKCRATDKHEWGADAIFTLAGNKMTFQSYYKMSAPQNEIDAAKLVHLDYFNSQDQPKLVWPASIVVARAYLDQLARSSGVAPDSVAALQRDLAAAEKLSGPARRDALTSLGTRLEADAGGAADPAKVRTLAA